MRNLRLCLCTSAATARGLYKISKIITKQGAVLSWDSQPASSVIRARSAFLATTPRAHQESKVCFVWRYVCVLQVYTESSRFNYVHTRSVIHSRSHAACAWVRIEHQQFLDIAGARTIRGRFRREFRTRQLCKSYFCLSTRQQVSRRQTRIRQSRVTGLTKLPVAVSTLN